MVLTSHPDELSDVLHPTSANHGRAGRLETQNTSSSPFGLSTAIRNVVCGAQPGSCPFSCTKPMCFWEESYNPRRDLRKPPSSIHTMAGSDVPQALPARKRQYESRAEHSHPARSLPPSGEWKPQQGFTMALNSMFPAPLVARDLLRRVIPA